MLTAETKTARRPLLYLTNQYPKVSHTFIRREIQALERQGHNVLRVSIRRVKEPLVDPQDIAEDKSTTYVLESGVHSLLKTVCSAAAHTPTRFLAALAQVRKMWRLSNQPFYLHFVYFVEACWLAAMMRRT